MSSFSTTMFSTISMVGVIGTASRRSNGPIWLTIPVIKKGAVENHTPINEIFIDWTRDWSRKHWKTIEQAYGKAPFFDLYTSILKELYEQRCDKLADLTVELTILIARALGISETKFVRSSSLNASGIKTDRLLGLLSQLGATHYITGPAAKNYLDEAKTNGRGNFDRVHELRLSCIPAVVPAV